MTVSIVNQWTGAFAMPAGNVYTPPAGASLAVTLTGMQGGGTWLVALLGWQAPPGYVTTMAAGDDALNYWVPLGAPAGTSSPAGNVRCSVWAAPYAMTAGILKVAPSGYTPAYGALILEVAGLGPGLSLAAVDNAYANAATSVAAALPAPSQQVITLACAASDDNADTVTMAGTGWSALTAVATSNGSDHAADLTLTSGWQVTSGAVTASWSSTGSLDLACCAVSLAVTQAAPSGPSQGWPYEQFQAALGAGIATPWDQLAWTDLTPRFRGFSGTRGKQYELDSVQAASMPVTLSNNDGALTPGNTASPYYLGISSWTGRDNASLFLSQAYAWSGASSMLMVPDGVTASPYAESEMEPVTASTSGYSASAAVLCPQGWTSGVAAVINWYDASRTYLSASTGTATSAPAGQWAYPSVTAASPSGAAYAAIAVRANSTPPSTTLFFWDFCQLTSPAGAVLNSNWNFSTGPQVYTPVRHLATWGGRTYVAWRGFMERWPQSLSPARYTVSDAVATDVWAGLTALLPDVIQGEILNDEPYAYWPATDPAGSTQAANLAPTSAGPLVVTESKFGSGAAGAQAFGANSGALAGAPSATTWQQSGLATGTTDQAHGWCLKYQDAAMPLISQGVTVETWVNFAAGADPSDELIVWVMRGSSGTLAQLWGSYSGVGGAIGWYLSVTDKVTKAITTTPLLTPFGIETGWIHFAVKLTSTTWSVVIDGGGITPTNASGSCNLSDNWQWISWGGSADKIYTGGFGNISLARMAVYPRVLPQSRIVAHYFAGSNGLAGDPAGYRIDRLLSYAGMEVPRRVNEAAATTMQPASDISGQALAQNLTNIAQSEGGLLAVDRCGYLAYTSRGNRWNLPAAWYAGEQAAVVLNRNWDFETGVSPWTAGSGGVTIAQSSAQAFSGLCSMLVTPSAGNSAAASELVPALAGNSYTGSAQILSPGGWASGARIQVSWYSAAQGYLSTSSGTAAPLNAGQWTPFAYSVTAPAGAAYAQLLISLAGSPTSSDTYYADQAQLVAAGEIPYLGDIAFGFDPSLVYDDITLTQYLGTTITASSATSMAQYGDQTLQETVYATDTGQVTDLANWILGTYGIPAVRAAQFTVNAAANPYAWPFVLSADTGTVIWLSRRLGGTQTVISGLFSIQSVSPQKAPGQYQVRYSATPYFQGSVLATNDPVHGLPNGSNYLPW